MKVFTIAPMALIALCLSAAVLPAQIADFEFDQGSYASTDTDTWSTVSDLLVSNTHQFADWNSHGWFLCLNPNWATQAEATPQNQSPNYIETTITPSNGFLWITGMSFTTGTGSAPNVDTIAIYADQDPGPGGDNFATRLSGPIDIFPQHPGQGGIATVNVDLSSVAFLQGADQAVTLRVYFWSSQEAGSHHAEIGKITVEGCSGLAAEVLNLGSSCNNQYDPVFTSTAPAIGTTVTWDVTSQFPGALGFNFFSFAPVTPWFEVNSSCFVFVDILNPSNFWLFSTYLTDSNGNWQLQVPLPDLPALIGLEFVVQTRLCAPNAPIAGPLNPDWLSNGLAFRVGCPITTTNNP